MENFSTVGSKQLAAELQTPALDIDLCLTLRRVAEGIPGTAQLADGQSFSWDLSLCSTWGQASDISKS